MKKTMCGKRTFIGFDTETINNGQVVIIANSNKDYLLLPTIKEILEFLLKYESNRYIGYFYNLDYDLKSIIMTIAEHNNKLNDIKTFLEFNHLIYENYTISYIAGKKLSIFENLELKLVKYKDKYGIWKNRDCVTYTRKSEYYDIAQFYLNDNGKIMSLENASQKFLGYGKFEIDNIGEIDINRLKKDKFYQEKLISYCIRDCHLTKRLCYIFYNEIKEYINVRKMLSPAFLSQKYIIKNLKDKGIKNEFSNEYILKYEKEILESYYGGRFETFKKGIIPGGKGYLADINSAYPFIMSQFEGLTGKATVTKGDYLELDKCYPICLIELEPNNLYLNPLPFKTKENLVYFPSNKKTIKKYVSQWSIKLLDLMNIDYNIIEIIKFWKTENKIFDFIHDLYKLKKESEKYRKIAKIILNSMYGKTIERTDRIVLTNESKNNDYIRIGDYAYYFEKIKKQRGTLYNPLWGAMITDFCRYYVLEPIIKNKLQNNLYQIATDSILLDKKPDLDYNKLIGGWDLDILDNPIIYGNGIMKHKNGFKSRGFSCIDEKHFQTVINTKKYTKKQIVPLSHYKKHGFDKLHSFQLMEKKFSILDKKRLFPEVEPKDLLNITIDSEPLFIN